jgi:U3 small nucleolar RNA-associated protein 11
MSSFKKAIQSKTHRERSQPLSREGLGLLEKHKDYVERARDYQSKQKRLKQMRNLAANRNPDEFYFKMINQKTKNGVHVVNRQTPIDKDVLSLMKSQDIKYINMFVQSGKKKIERLISNNVGVFESTGKHTVFVDDDEEMNAFKPEEYFNTHPSLLKEKANRLRKDQLCANPLEDISEDVESDMKKVLRELGSRVERDKKLKLVQKELQLHKNLTSKGKRVKISEDKDGVPIYKWKAERKK